MHRLIEDLEHQMVTILLVDDDDIDRKAIKRGFESANLLNPIVEAENGLEALKLLRTREPDNRIERPFIILLDINMPTMNGIEFLKELRKDSVFKDSFVIVHSTSNLDQDKKEVERLGVANYIIKTDQEISKIFETVEHHFQIVKVGS